jgi:SAM-dependent methyltransferase
MTRLADEGPMPSGPEWLTMRGRLEETVCPLCGSAEGVPVHRFEPYRVVRCRRCRVDFLSPRLTEPAMRAMYESGEYFEGGAAGYDSYLAQEPALRATFRSVVANLVKAGFAGGELLEVGSGYGYFLDEARAAFSAITGTELSARAAAAARSLGLPVVTGGLDALPVAARFDCIFSGHVIEHVYEPAFFMARLVGLLRPGGVLVLGTPDGGSGWRRLMGSRWPSYKLPEHVVFYDRQALARLFAEAGLINVRPFPYPHAFPLALILQRLGLGWLARRSGHLGRQALWLPATTTAMSGRRREGPADGA